MGLVSASVASLSRALEYVGRLVEATARRPLNKWVVVAMIAKTRKEMLVLQEGVKTVSRLLDELEVSAGLVDFADRRRVDRGSD